MVLLLQAQTVLGAYKLVCYYSNQAWRRSQPVSWRPSDVDPCLCTHLVYAFATISDNKIATMDESDDNLYKMFNSIKERNYWLHTLLAVGGEDFDMTSFTKMASSSENRTIFIDSVIHLLRSFKFDGIDLHFQYPGSGVSPPEDKHRFTLLVQEMVTAFQFEAAKSGLRLLMVTAAVSAQKATIEAGYEMAELSQSLDFISVMTYDFHGGWKNMTAHHSPLYPGSTDQGDSVYFNCEYAMNYWKNATIPTKKLLMGFPTFGRTFTLSSTTNCTVGSPASGDGSAGSYTQEAGILAYYEICQIPDGNSTSFEFSKEQQVPFACYGNQWVGYDDPYSFELKVEFVIENGFGGAAVWSLDMDDLKGSFCNKGVYPLTGKLKAQLGLDTGMCSPNPVPWATMITEVAKPTTASKEVPSITKTTSASPAATPSKGRTTTKSPRGGAEFCVGKPDGIHANPKDKTNFYLCGLGTTFVVRCPRGHLFDTSCKCCSYV
ncbi:acidic mammalian chitinase-like [Lissotriton helveticus]